MIVSARPEKIQQAVEDGLMAFDAGGDPKVIASNVTNEIMALFKITVPAGNHPRIFASDRTFLDSLERLRKNPEELSGALSMAAGFIAGAPPDDERRNLGIMFAAAIYVAQMNLFPGTDFGA